MKVLTVSSLGDFFANLRAKITDNHKENEVQVFELGMSVLKSLSFQVRLSDKFQTVNFWLENNSKIILKNFLLIFN